MPDDRRNRSTTPIPAMITLAWNTHIVVVATAVSYGRSHVGSQDGAKGLSSTAVLPASSKVGATAARAVIRAVLAAASHSKGRQRGVCKPSG